MITEEMLKERAYYKERSARLEKERAERLSRPPIPKEIAEAEDFFAWVESSNPKPAMQPN